MNDFLDALKSRFKSPILGYLLLSSFAINWRSAFYLMVDNGTVLSRIEYFDAHTTLSSLLLVPAIFSITIILINPWVKYGLTLVSSKPSHLYEILNVRAEHKILIEKKKLEDARAKILASAENELIERAARDQKVEALENESLRDKLRSEIDQLRKEQDELKSLAIRVRDTRTLELSDEAKTLLTAATNGDGTIMHRRYIGGSSIQVTGKNFMDDGSRRTAAKWEAALVELLNRGFIEDKSGKREVYYVTKSGFEFADENYK